jgi:hypothetical protein
MKKQIFLLIAILLSNVMAFAQNGYLIVPSGAYIHISGNPSIVLDNASLNNNGTYVSASDELLFTGNLAQTIDGSSNNTFNKLTSDNSGGVTLNSNSIISDAMTINSGANLTLASGKTLTVDGTTTLNEAECFIIKTDASFIDNGFAGSGTARVEKNLSETPSRWWYMGIPLSTAVDASSFGTISTDAGTNTHLFFWDELGQSYSPIANGTVSLNSAATPLRGYAVKNYAGDISAAFIGSLNTGTIVNSGLSMNTGIYAGFNLVCNPYPSAIDWGNIDATGIPAGLARTGVDLSIWFPNGSNGFSTYNGQSGTAVPGTVTQYIPAMQGFWVHVSSATGSLSMNNATRLHNAHSFYKVTANNLFRMDVSNGSLYDETAVGFYQNALESYEAYDSRKMYSTDNNAPQIYSLTSDNMDMVINGYPQLAVNNERIVSLGFKTNVAGSFTMNATNLADFDQNISVYLEDVQLNVLQDLRQNSAYSFSSGVVNDASRFKLHFGDMLTSIPAVAESDAFVYSSENTIYVNTPKTATIKVYDILGNLIMNQQSIQGLNKLQLNVITGVYIVNVQTGTKVTTQKVIISK